MLKLKLANESGGKPLSNTSWSIITFGGDVLAEGSPAVVHLDEDEDPTDLRVIARNRDRTYEKTVHVTPGVDMEVEVLLIKTRAAGRTLPGLLDRHSRRATEAPPLDDDERPRLGGVAGGERELRRAFFGHVNKG